jgi:hypothetical protein
MNLVIDMNLSPDWVSVLESAGQETLYLTGIPGMRESIQKGLRTPVDKCDRELDW